MNSFLLLVAGLFVLALSALFTAPYFVNWNEYRDAFEAQASKMIGRQVDVGGNVSLTLLPAPVLRFETINVADANGKFETPFAAAKSVTVWLSVPPLLRGTIEARTVEIVQPVVNIRIEEDGTGNWSSLGGEAPDLPFIPKDVALNSVMISDATVNIWRGKPEPDAVLESVAGELSARALQGPYKFNGQFTLAGKTRDLRFSTGKQEEDGAIRLKVSVRSPEAKENFTIDGAVRGLSRIPVFKGEFRARLSDDSGSTEVSREADKQQVAAPIEIRSELFAGLTGAQFNEFDLTITKNDKPQSIRGLMDMKFEKGLVLEATFSSRWIDIDSWFASTGDKSHDLKIALEKLAGELLDRTSSVREGSIRLLLDQAVFAGDLSTNLRLNLAVSDNKLEIADFSARLPGENRLRLSGGLSRTLDGVEFKGPVSAEGDSLSRLLRWAGVAGEPEAVTEQGDFSFSCNLAAGPQGVELNDVKGTLFGSKFDGAFNYNGGAESTIALTLNSDQLDLTRLVGTKATAKSLTGILFGRPVGNGQAGESRSLSGWPAGLRAEADVNVRAVTLAGLGETALELQIALDKDAVDIHRFSLTSGTHLAVQAGGRLTGLGGKPEGNLTFAMHADSGAGIRSLSEFFELGGIAQSTPERLGALSPLDLTAAIRSSAPQSAGLDVHVEGSLGKSELLLKMDIDGRPSDWQTAKIVVQGGISNQNGTELLQQLRPGLSKQGLSALSANAGRLSIDAEGAVSTGLQSKIVLDAGGGTWTTSGVYKRFDGASSFAGTTGITAQSTAAALALVGILVPEGQGTEPAQISASVESAQAVHQLSGIKGQLGGASWTGEVRADMSGEKPVFAATVRADEASLPRLLAPALMWNSRADRSQYIRGVTQPDAYWPDAAFDGGFLNAFDGTLFLEAARLRMSGDLALAGATMRAEASNGAITVSALEGKLYGGAFKAHGELKAHGSGVVLDMETTATGLRLEELMVGSDGEPLVVAPADLKLSVKGEGLSPRGLVSGLRGSGQLTIHDGELKGFSLGAAHVAASVAQKELSSGADEAMLGKRVSEQLASTEMAFSSIKIPLSVSNGIVEFEKIAMSDSEGRVIIASYLQLANLQLDSEWALQSVENGTGQKPRVSLVFSGDLQKLGRIRPSIDTAALARYVTIQKMEKDVERLEKLDVTGKKPGPPPPSAQSPEPGPPAAGTGPVTANAVRPDPSAIAPPSPAPPLPVRKQPASNAAIPPPAPGAAPPAALNASQPQAPVAGPSIAAVPKPTRKLVPAVPPAIPQKPVPIPSRKPAVPRAAPLPTSGPPAAVSSRPRPVPETRPAQVPPTAPPEASAAAPPAAQPEPPLPWLQNVSPPAAQPGASPPGDGPTQLPLPPPVAQSTGQTPPDSAAPPQPPATRFDPFSGSAN